MSGIVKAIFICPTAGTPMQEVNFVEAIAGKGLKGDRYANGEGSFNRKKPWWRRLPLFGRFFGEKRQVTFMNARFFIGSGFEFADSRRNIFVEGVELMELIGKKFYIGGVCFRGVKYCDPCNRPTKLSGKSQSFKETFFDRGGLIAEVVKGGVFRPGTSVITPKKGY